ncbi:hypothetical protein RUM44_011658 [Polyplax serrata]|uniref:Ig-like domain-containing protein n=1 Tax=Polyplax serrata TaxID=468196 RepID=A0ABR1AQN7_POLSC
MELGERKKRKIFFSNKSIFRKSLVVNQKYDVQVYDEYVVTGNTAVLRCQVPSDLVDYVLITSWIQDDVVHIYPTTDTEKNIVEMMSFEVVKPNKTSGQKRGHV